MYQVTVISRLLILLCSSILVSYVLGEDEMVVSVGNDSDYPMCSGAECRHHVSNNVGRVFETIPSQNLNIRNVMNNSNWENVIEGNCLAYFGKLQSLQYYANDTRVETICEIGFNAGYSAINFLIANEKARLISFDILLNPYTPAAIRSVHGLFPNRKIIVIGGDSTYSIRSAIDAGLFDQHKCNLIFIDGGHTREVLLNDLYYADLMANQTYNRVIVDDLENEVLYRIWEDLDPSRTNKLASFSPLGYKQFDYLWNETLKTYSFELSHQIGRSVLAVFEYVY